MSYQAITIKQAVGKINKDYFLPAIQREFVWGPEQIEQLFDSLMRGYPIGSFLFWDVKGEDIGQLDFYRFIKAYDKTAGHNPKEENLQKRERITAVLDGQQRLTALYIGLCGSYIWRDRGRPKGEETLPKRKLYLNLLYEQKDDDDYAYEFKFLTDEQAQETEESIFWFQVSKAYEDNFKITDFIIYECEAFERERKATISSKIEQLISLIRMKPIINFYTEESQDIDKVLNIFVRINSGGIKLSYSDLLLSMATAHWITDNETRNARDEVHDFVKELNDYGFSFDKDFVLKAWLVLSDSPVAFKVKNFQKHMDAIRKKWGAIQIALKNSVKLAKQFGYNGDNLTTTYALLPVAYYFMKRPDIDKSYFESQKTSEDREKIRVWIASAILKKVFGGRPDAVLSPLREVLKKNNASFPLEKIAEELKSSKSIYFSEDDISDLMDVEYGKETYVILSQLCIFSDTPLDFGQVHQDHIFPKAWFNKKNLETMGVAQDRIKAILDAEKYNKLPNLHFLSDTLNQEKSAKDPDEWFKALKGNGLFKHASLVPEDMPLSMDHFEEFIRNRENLLKEKLSARLLARPKEEDSKAAA